MAFNDLQIKVMAEAAIEVAGFETEPLTLFAHSFNGEIAGKFGEAISVPILDIGAAGEFDATNRNYCSGENIGGALINLNKHYVKSVAITDVQRAYTGISWVRGTAEAIGRSLAKACVDHFWTTVNGIPDGDVTVDNTLDLTDKDKVWLLPSVALTSDIPVRDSVVVLSPTAFAAVLSAIGPYGVLGRDEAMRTGVLRDALGFKAIVQSGSVNGNGGYIIPSFAVGTVAAALEPVVGGDWAQNVQTDKGFAFNLRTIEDKCTGNAYLTGTCLFGVKALAPKKIVRIKGN